MLAFVQGILCEAYGTDTVSRALSRFRREQGARLRETESLRERYYWAMTVFHVWAVCDAERVRRERIEESPKRYFMGLGKVVVGGVVRELLREGWLTMDDIDPPAPGVL